jgi:hypothetical protein
MWKRTAFADRPVATVTAATPSGVSLARRKARTRSRLLWGTGAAVGFTNTNSPTSLV